MRGRVDLRDEQGAVLLLVVFLVPLFLVFASLALDISNWYVHKRHAQVQADAAALAGASQLLLGPACDDARVGRLAREYADRNGELGGETKAVDVEVNEEIAGSGLQPPCAERKVAVRIRESDLPWFLKVADLVDVGGEVSTSARSDVALEQVRWSDDVLPVTAQDEAVTHVRAFLVDENGDTGEPLPAGPGEVTSQELTVGGSSGATDTWVTPQPLSVDRVTQRNLGVRVAVSYGSGSACGGADTTCYAKESSGIGLFHVHGFAQPDPNQAGDPLLRRAELVSCPTSPSPSFTTTDCTLDVRASLDFGNVVDRLIAEELDGSPDPDCSEIVAVRAQLGGGGYADLDCAQGSDGPVFEGSFPLAADSGPRPLKITYVLYAGRNNRGGECGDGAESNPKPCWGWFDGDRARGYSVISVPRLSDREIAEGFAGVVNRAYGGGPVHTDEIEAASVTFAGGSRAGQPANAVDRCADDESCPQRFNVAVDLPKPLELGDERDLATKSVGANDGLLDCDPLRNGAFSVEDSMARGCPVRLGIHPAGQDCPRFEEFGADLPQPWTCLPTFKGNPARATRGLTRRVFFGGGPERAVDADRCAAHPDRWPNWDADPEDPRIAAVALTGRGELDVNSNHVVPVHDIAFFYVRGWGGNPCAQGAGNGGTDIDVPDGVVRGTFIKYVRPNDGGVAGSGGACEDTRLGGCVPVMTR